MYLFLFTSALHFLNRFSPLPPLAQCNNHLQITKDLQVVVIERMGELLIVKISQ